MEVFIGSPPYDNFGELGTFRAQIRDLVMYAWARQPQVYLRAFISGPRDRWITAESKAQGNIYILADDDCLPPYNLNLEQVSNLFDEYPEFGMLAIGNTTEYGMYADQNIIEAGSVGGIRFLRRGMVTSWPENFSGDDNQYAGLMRVKGFRSAYVRRYGLQHLGDGYSVWQKIRDGVAQ
jgi:hypothetical protein